MGLVRRLSSTLVKWSEKEVTASDIGVHDEMVFALQVDISSLNAGNYILELTTRVAGQDSVRVGRTIRVKKE